MTRQILWRSAASDEFVAAVEWYEEQRPGLGDEFADACRAALRLIQAQPQAFAELHGPVRRVVLRRFPYGIFYITDPDALIVLAVMHHRRDPHRLRDRR